MMNPFLKFFSELIKPTNLTFWLPQTKQKKRTVETDDET